MRLPLRYQVFALMAGLMLFTLLATSAVTAAVQSRRTRANVDHELDRLVQTLEASSFPLTQPVLDQLRGLTGAEFVLTDPWSHALSAATDPALASEAADLARSLSSARDVGVVTISGRRFFHRTVVLSRYAAGAPPKRLHILYPESIWTRARLAAVYPPLVTGAAGMAVAGVLSYWLARSITRPIGLLSRQMDRLAAGNYEPLPTAARRDELGELIVAANTLAGRLRDLNLAIRRGERLAVLGRLGGGLAHQLRNGVTGARLAVQLHARGCAQDGESLDAALRQLELVEQQVVSFLSLGKPREIHKSPCNVSNVVKEVGRLVAAACRHRAITLQVEPEAGFIADADGDALRQLLMNLALNATEACERGGRVRIVLARRDDDVSLSVIDSGPGIEREIEASLFEPFTTTKPEGVGLGLAVAHQIAAAHDGCLTYSRQGGETCFELRFPLQAARCAGSAAAGPTEVTEHV